MKNRILIACGNQREWKDLDKKLRKQFIADQAKSLETIKKKLLERKYLALIIDIDSITIDNITIRQLTLDFPGIPLFCISIDKFHPELKDAICYHIYACINKPIDFEELQFWLQSIQTDTVESAKEY